MHLAIDCGVSRHVAAVWFQVRPVRYVPVRPAGSLRAGAPPGLGPDAAGGPLAAEHGLRSTVTVFGDFHCEGLYSEAAARAIVAHGADAARLRRACPTVVRLDPAASARTGIGPTAYAEFERVFGPSVWPGGRRTG